MLFVISWITSTVYKCAKASDLNLTSLTKPGMYFNSAIEKKPFKELRQINEFKNVQSKLNSMVSFSLPSFSLGHLSRNT